MGDPLAASDFQVAGGLQAAYSMQAASDSQALRRFATHAGEGRCGVTLEAAAAPDGGGLACYLYGGEVPHVGGQALAAPGPELGGRQLSRADVWDATLPGHKDAEAARGVARRLAIACGCAVSVAAGIHVEDATADDLATIGANVDACVDALVAKLAGDPSADPAARDRLILVDFADREVGTGEKLDVHRRSQLHRAFSVFLLDGDRLLLQRRALGKYHSGGLWTNSCCSHPRAGETLAEAVSRRLAQELGVSGVDCNEVGSFVYRAAFANGITEYEYDHVLVGEWAGASDPGPALNPALASDPDPDPAFTLNPDPAEVMDWRWVVLNDLSRDVAEHPDRYTAWLPEALRLVLASR